MFGLAWNVKTIKNKFTHSVLLLHFLNKYRGRIAMKQYCGRKIAGDWTKDFVIPTASKQKTLATYIQQLKYLWNKVFSLLYMSHTDLEGIAAIIIPVMMSVMSVMVT